MVRFASVSKRGISQSSVFLKRFAKRRCVAAETELLPLGKLYRNMMNRLSMLGVNVFGTKNTC